MGERDPGLAPPSPPRTWLPWAPLAGLLAGLLGLVLVLDPVASATEAAGRSLAARLLMAPLALVAAERAPSILGVLMLAVAAAVGGLSLERSIGSTAPLVVGLLIFGSAGWAAVWGSGTDLVPLALAVVAFALVYGGGSGAATEPAEIYRPEEEARGGVGRWLTVGLLLAELVPTTPLLAGLLVPAGLAVPRQRRRVLVPALLGGFALGVAVELAVQGPGLVTGPVAVAAASFHPSPALAGWTLVHLLVGRNVGLVVGFAPLLLLLLLGRGATERPTLAGVCLGLSLLGALVLPFDFAGGWLHLSFLPLYGALWHLPTRQPRGWEWTAVVLVCGLATWPLWVAPRAAAAEGVTLAAAWPRRYLPYETTLRALPNRGETAFDRSGLRLRAVSGCRYLGGPGRFELEGDRPAEIWLAAPTELEMVALELGPGAPSSFAVAGAEAGRTVFRPDGRVGFELLLSQPRGRHPLWFGEGELSIHLLEVTLPERQDRRPLRFRLLAAPR